MRGYHSGSYGDAFADVYDDWYRDLGDVDAVVACIGRLAPHGAVLELGVGTGRMAIPLAAAGHATTGIDSSDKMLERLAANDVNDVVVRLSGDMVDDLPAGPFDVVLCAYNTIFNLLDPARQRRCFVEVGRRLAPDGMFVVEAFVPQRSGDTSAPSNVSVRSMGVDHVVLSASTHDEVSQRAEGQFVEITESGGVRLRPWAIRYATLHELDTFATEGGLVLDSRWADFAGTPFDDTSERHVSVFRRS